MKPYIDFFETFKSEFLGVKRFRNRFIKRWGTQTIDGVEVLNERFTVYPGWDYKNSDGTYTENANNIQNMCKMLGSLSQIKEADFSPIAGYYFWLNPAKDEAVELEKELLAEKVDLFCPFEEWFESTINYVDTEDPSKFNGWTKEQILEYIDNDYRNIFSKSNGFVIEDELIPKVMGKYVLFDDGTEFEVEVVSSAVTSIAHTPAVSIWYGRTKTIYYTGLNLVIRWRRIAYDVDPDGLLVTAMMEEEEEARLYDLAQMSKSTNVEDESGNFNLYTATVTNDVWYKSQLRLSAINSSSIKTQVAVDTILGVIDTGQIKKKVKWYKKLLGFVLIIISLVVAFYTGGGSLSLTSVATALGVAMFVMTLIQAKWAKTNAAAAGYMGRWISIASMVSLAVGIANIYQSIAKTALRQTATAGLVATGVAEATAQTAVASMSEVAIQEFVASAGLEVGASAMVKAASSMLLSSWKSVAFKVVEKVVSMRQEQMAADLENKSQQLEDSNEALEDMMDKNLHIGIKDIEWYTDLDGLAASRYDVDHYYEAEPATMHVGNICRASFYNGLKMNLRAEDMVKS